MQIQLEVCFIQQEMNCHFLKIDATETYTSRSGLLKY